MDYQILLPAPHSAHQFAVAAIMDITRRQLTNVATMEPTRAPMGQLRRLRSYPVHSVPAPNADILYTDA